MSEVYSFLFCIALGIAARLLYMAVSLLSAKTNIFPVTIVLDTLLCVAVGCAFAVYIIMSGAVLAPYMFAALLGGYYLTYCITKKDTKQQKRGETRRKSRILRKSGK